AHERLHAVGLTGDDTIQGFGVHDQGDVRVFGVAFTDRAGAVLDHGVEVGIILDVELKNQIQASSGGRVELAFHVFDDFSNGSHGFFLYRMFRRATPGVAMQESAARQRVGRAARPVNKNHTTV